MGILDKMIDKDKKPTRCRDCKAFKEYEENGKKKYRCIVHKRAVIISDPDNLPLWCPHNMDPAIKKLIDRQNERRKQ